MITIIVILSAVIGLSQIDTRVGTDAADSPTASIFGAAGEVFGNCVPCVTEPNGMTGWTAQTRISEKKGVAPYYYSDPEWLGFRASHWLIGSAVQDYGTFYILPGGKALPMDHSKETATPGYYSYDGHELTALSRSAIMKLDCDEIIVGVPNQYDEGCIQTGSTGASLDAGNPIHRFYAGRGKYAGYSGWIHMEFSRPIVKVTMLDERRVLLEFAGSGPLLVKAGTSFTSVEAAKKNLAAEIPGWDFGEIRSRAEKAWEERLRQIEVEGGSEQARIHFYTSLWRTSLQPRIVSDCGQEPDYDDFSMWDIFRALLPLQTILHPEQEGQMMQALVRKFERGGWLPIFPLWGSYTCAMIGDHCISAFADAYTKGICNFDVRTAWEAVRKNCFETPSEEEYLDGKGRRVLDTYIRLGFVPLEEKIKDAFHSNEQTSRTLEYAYDDWCAWLLARDFGAKEERRALRKRAGNWRNAFDPRTLYPQGRRENGSFLDEPGNYLNKTPFITEGTPCHYSWFVPHDVKGLIKMFGKDEFEARLDSMFTENRYWHGNEPCHQVAYLYDYIGRPEKTQAAVQNILRTEYRNTPGGLSGNDDAGQMSAWYVMSSMGLYSVCPGAAEYALGAPSFDKVTIHLENGRDFTAVRSCTSDELSGHFRWNSRRLRKPFITHRQLMRGGTLLFE